MRTSFTSELTTAPNAAPMTTATARSTAFPFSAKSRNSLSMASLLRAASAVRAGSTRAPERTGPTRSLRRRCRSRGLAGVPTGGRAAETEETGRPAASHAADERLRLVVERRIVHELPRRAVAVIELRRHAGEIGGGAVDVPEHAVRVRLVLHEPHERATAA